MPHFTITTIFHLFLLELDSSFLTAIQNAAEPEMSPFLFNAFFLVKTWHLHYPQFNSIADSLVGDSGM